MPSSASLDFLFSRENFERRQRMPYDPARMNLARMRRLMEELGSLEQQVPAIHVAGTKGKGSTAAMIAAVLQAAGLRTGLFTSPHLEQIEERIQLDGRPCIGQFDELAELVRPAVERLDREAESGDALARPTFFEILTAMAFVYFAREKADAAVMEVGLGGRLDATNVCRPAVSIITSISFDHTQQLGNTLAAIAGEKAGIVRPGVPVVSGVVEEEPREVIRRAARERGAPLFELGVDFDFAYEPPQGLQRGPAAGKLEWRWTKEGKLQIEKCKLKNESWKPESRDVKFEICNLRSLPLALPGKHQAANAAVALAALEVVRAAGWKIPDEAVRTGLTDLHWPARVEVVARRPAVVLDTAHNVASAVALAETLRESFAVARRLLVFGTTQDKDARGMLARLLPEFDEVFFTRYQGSVRATPPDELQHAAEELTGRRWPIFDDLPAAWSAARAAATADDLICVTGSFYLAAEWRAAAL